jgi:hypothetical protein
MTGFFDGFFRGYDWVDQLEDRKRRREREDRDMAYQDEVRSRQRGDWQYQDKVRELEDDARAAAEATRIYDSVMLNPDGRTYRSYDDLQKDPEAAKTVQTLLNSPHFEKWRNANGRNVRIVGARGRGDTFALEAEVTDPQTGEVVSRGAVSENRATNVEDPKGKDRVRWYTTGGVGEDLRSEAQAKRQQLEEYRTYLAAKNPSFANAYAASRANQYKDDAVEKGMEVFGKPVAQPTAQPGTQSAPDDAPIPKDWQARAAAAPAGAPSAPAGAIPGASDNYLRTLWAIESGSGKNLRNPNSSARGHFQFVNGTARAYGLLGDGFDKRGDLEAETAAVVRMAQDDAAELQRNGLPVNDATLYLAHQQGRGGAVRLLKAAASDSPTVDKTTRQNMIANGGIGMTPREFVDFWSRKVEAKSQSSPVARPSLADGAPTQAVAQAPAQAAPQPPAAPERNPLVLDREARAQRRGQLNSIPPTGGEDMHVDERRALDAWDSVPDDQKSLLELKRTILSRGQPGAPLSDQMTRLRYSEEHLPVIDEKLAAIAARSSRPSAPAQRAAQAPSAPYGARQDAAAAEEQVSTPPASQQAPGAPGASEAPAEGTTFPLRPSSTLSPEQVAEQRSALRQLYKAGVITFKESVDAAKTGELYHKDDKLQIVSDGLGGYYVVNKESGEQLRHVENPTMREIRRSQGKGRKSGEADATKYADKRIESFSKLYTPPWAEVKGKHEPEAVADDIRRTIALERPALAQAGFPPDHTDWDEGDWDKFLELYRQSRQGDKNEETFWSKWIPGYEARDVVDTRGTVDRSVLRGAGPQEPFVHLPNGKRVDLEKLVAQGVAPDIETARQIVEQELRARPR